MTAGVSTSSSGREERVPDAYARAGVNLAARNDLVERIKQVASRASRPEVLSGVGPFGAMFKLAEYKSPVLVSSTDGVGTKIRIAQAMGRYDTVGQDLVNHCVNDILTSGAHPLFFLDYLGSSDLADDRKLDVIDGMARACEAHGCALCCHDTEMPVTEDDIKRLEALGHDRAAFTLVGPQGFRQLANVDGKCFFLKDERCSVYSDRPQGCRIYPFVLTEKGTLTRDEDCPWRREFPHDGSAKRRIERIYVRLRAESERLSKAGAKA